MDDRYTGTRLIIMKEPGTNGVDMLPQSLPRTRHPDDPSNLYRYKRYIFHVDHVLTTPTLLLRRKRKSR